jgi:hypothetical protein
MNKNNAISVFIWDFAPPELKQKYGDGDEDYLIIAPSRFNWEDRERFVALIRPPCDDSTMWVRDKYLGEDVFIATIRH